MRFNPKKQTLQTIVKNRRGIRYAGMAIGTLSVYGGLYGALYAGTRSHLAADITALAVGSVPIDGYPPIALIGAFGGYFLTAGTYHKAYNAYKNIEREERLIEHFKEKT